MTETELLRILNDLRIEQSDNRMYETKAAMTDFPTSAAKTLCAFTNMPGGGTILFGVDEKSNFTITGVYDSLSLPCSAVPVFFSITQQIHKRKRRQS